VALISLIDVALSGVASLAFGYLIFDVLGILLLLEGAVIMLIGGALGFAGQPGIIALSKLTSGFFGRRRGDEPEGVRSRTQPLDERSATKQNDVRAAFYMLVGALLFLESLVLAFVIH